MNCLIRKRDIRMAGQLELFYLEIELKIRVIGRPALRVVIASKDRLYAGRCP